MSQTFDLSLFPNLPPEVVQAFAAQHAALEAAQFEAVIERAARQHEQAVVAEKEAFITELKADRAAERPGSGLLAHEVRAEVGKPGPVATGTGAGRSGNGHRRDTGPDRRCRGQDRGQRTGSREEKAPGAPQDADPA